MKKLKVYIAGKVSPNSVFGRHDWRDEFCAKLAELSGFEFINLDPTKTHDDFNLDENNDKLIFGRDCFMIKSADLVIVNLTDDISVGGSQEMLIAKYYHKLLIGIAPKNGKFCKDEKEILSKIYKNWIHPFVSIPCDIIVEDINGVADFIKNFFLKPDKFVKSIEVLDESLQYYKDNHHKDDQFLHVIGC
ncbi:MAG: hypothetical protein CO042_03360 [Parcubacteria group bacterium CG_4_9_14_0_2_um_filter_41_8]|nr:MAG: hypothetical protein AUJ34_00025 [Parcubacteria group bacterium CG1_02_41_12]PJC40522.1 MAG: hypothetical protein CO042_03360 [Parcubacteria group bacterium CG_4_9_14_0_2_um_filter_41_8]